MKSRYEFGTDDQYYEYLVHYYVGQCISGILSVEYTLLEKDTYVDVAIRYAKAIVEQLKKEG